MNNRRGIMTTLLTAGAASAAIYGITRGVQNGTFQRLPQTINNALNNPQVQQVTQPLQNMANNQNVQQVADTLEEGADSIEQGIENFNQNY
ncbi:hypothetical protein [Aquibacillus albus]|uniref:UDP:flavonoid glycosyltransferase YjiC (YdhE family) n=1 Tax=Aquibacillus albus TaxID=1168171 RepID=A0ABS2MY22_9BACI|nr:hypothetical protein [Aquibacillus albus]MBM7570736.1 UDP:flavonoid glycosyltransferase YjiC (YdhE family) [Aquibacillus albus]